MKEIKFQSRARAVALLALGLGLVFVTVIVADYGLPRFGSPRERRGTSGRLELLDTGVGEIQRYGYDSAGLLNEIRYSRKGRWTNWKYPAKRSVRFEHDASLRLTSMDDETGRTTLKWDDFGSIASVTSPQGMRLVYGYDPWGSVRDIGLPGGGKLSYRYDVSQRLTEVASTGFTVTYEYNMVQREVVRRLSNGIKSIFRRDESGQMALIRHERADGSPVLELRYARDSDGRVTQTDEETSKGVTTRKYQYDVLGRLSHVIGSDGDVELAYDADGNLLSRKDAHGTLNYQYERGRLVRVGNERFDYDGAGRIITRAGPGGTTRYEWDGDQRLIAVRTNAATLRYRYRADGVRAERSLGDVRTYYLYDSVAPVPQVIAEHDGKGKVTHDILGLSRVGHRDASGAVSFYPEDQLGSTRVIADEKGDVVARYDYSEFGKPTRIEGSVAGPYLYTGEAWDADSGLLYLRHRYYDPAIGRFISQDPHPPSLESPQSLNRYAYCENDPVNRADPTGLQSWQPPPPPPTYYDPNRELWRILSLHRELPSMQLFRPAVLPPALDTRYIPPPWISKNSESSFTGLSSFTLAPPRYPLVDDSANRWWKILPGMAAQSLKSGELFYADTPYQHGIRAVVRGLSLIPPLKVPFGTLNSALAINDMWYYHEHGNDTKALLKGADQLAGIWIGQKDWLGRGDLGKDLMRYQGFYKLGREIWQSQIPQTLSARFVQKIESARDPLDYVAVLDPIGAGAFNRTRNLFIPPPPPPPPSGSASPLVGGVYLDQTAKILGDLGNITGAMFDHASGRLVLIGDRQHTLPPMKPEYLAAAIRAVYTPSPEAPGMTIDPNPGDPRGPVMMVRFFGGTEYTSLGGVMFEADRVMKAMSVGRDNLTRAQFSSGVPGYQSVTARQLETNGGANGLWSRFWLVPEPVTARVGKDGIFFDPIRMHIKTETMRWAGGKLVSAGGVQDPLAEAFARHFSEHYDEFAKEQPIFAELKLVTQAVALARWLKEQKVPADWGFVAQVLAEPYPTPSATPSAYNEIESRSSNAIRRVNAIGGVDMQPKLAMAISPDVDTAMTSVLAAVDATPLAVLDVAKVQVGGRDQVAAVLPTNDVAELGTYETAVSDFSVPAWARELEGLPGLTRFYSSSQNPKTELGYGWSLRVLRLSFEAPPGTPEHTQRTIAFEGMGSIVEHHFTLTDGKAAIRFTRPFADMALKRVGFASESEAAEIRGVYPEGNNLFRVFWARGDQGLFDLTGRLRALFRGEAKAIYSYRRDGRIDSIELSRGEHRLTVRFERDASGRLLSVAGGDRRVEYAYDASGNLSAVRGARALGYRYDEHHHPVEVTLDSQVAEKRQFDAFGRMIEQNTGDSLSSRQTFEMQGQQLTVTRTETGDALTTIYDTKLRMKHVARQNGSAVDYDYDGGHLSRVTTTLPGGGRGVVAFSAQGDITQLESPTGSKTEFKYLPDRKLTEILVGGQTYANFSYSANGLESVRYQGGYEERFVRNADGRVVQYSRLAPGDNETDPSKSLSLGRSDASAIPAAPSAAAQGIARDTEGRPVRVESLDGAVSNMKYTLDGEFAEIEILRGGERRALEIRGREITLRTSTGASATYGLDDRARVVSVRDALGHTTRYSYGSHGQLQSIGLPGGGSIVCREGVPTPGCG